MKITQMFKKESNKSHIDIFF